MTFKKIVLVASAIVFTAIALPLTEMGLDQIRQPAMIYKNLPLPAFSEDQDFAPRKYISLVRLESKTHGFFCSGTVISDDYVLTAAHCLMSEGMIPGMSKKDINVVEDTVGNEKTKSVVAHAAALNNRADYGLIKGDFREFTKAKIMHSPTMFAEMVGPFFTCGFPWGSTNVCYPTSPEFFTFYDQLKTGGRLYPGMSGGPVVDSGTHEVIAVNTAVIDGGIVVSPLVGLFETLGIEVTP